MNATLAARLNADTVREQQRALRNVEQCRDELAYALENVLNTFDEEYDGRPISAEWSRVIDEARAALRECKG